MNDLIGIHSVVKRKNEIISSEIDGSAVMMSIEDGRYYGMNAVGSDIWNMVEKPIGVLEIVARLMKQYDIEQEQCEGEVIAFLTKLMENGLIEAV